MTHQAYLKRAKAMQPALPADDIAHIEQHGNNPDVTMQQYGRVANIYAAIDRARPKPPAPAYDHEAELRKDMEFRRDMVETGNGLYEPLSWGVLA